MGNLNEKIKPTLDEPTSDQAIEFQDTFDKTMAKNGVQLTEVDKMLSEKEESLKKKIWNLAKMETLVHSDPKLSTVYDKMSEDGEEKYGYHYNETIMNIIFNDYVLNDPTYLQKYRQAIPKEKKRRDKSGINALRKDAEEMEKKRAEYRKNKAAKASTVQSLNERLSQLLESSSSMGSGGYNTPTSYKDGVDNVSKELDSEKELNNLNKLDTVLPGNERRAYGKALSINDSKSTGDDVSSAVDEPVPNTEVKKPFYPGGKITSNLNESEMKDENIENPEELDETTSAAGGATGSGGSADYTYVGPAAWGSGDLAGGKKTKKDKEPAIKGGKIIQEANPLIESMVYEEMFKQLEEDHLNSREEKINFISQYADKIVPDQSQYPSSINGWLNGLDDTTIDRIYHSIETGKVDQLGEEAKSKAQQRFMGMVHALQKGDLKPSEVGGSVKKAAASMTDKEAEDFASTKHDGLPEKVTENHMQTKEDKINYIINSERITGANGGEKDLEELRQMLMGMSDNTVDAIYDGVELHTQDAKRMGLQELRDLVESIIDQQEDSMKMKPPINTEGGDFPTGMQIATNMNENSKEMNIMEDAQKHLNDLNKDLELYKMHHEKLQEDRKPSTLVMKDRLGDENKKNFDKDLKHSGTKDIIDTTKELEWADQQTDVKDPQKLGADLEKEALKNGGKDITLKDVGNSANYKGNEIPKRNLSTEEQDEVDLYRKGLGDLNFDNDPGEKFMERMKQDMGEEQFKKREARQEFEAGAPMYNKDTQPMEDGIKKDQFDKNEATWNKRVGINESTMSGKYVDELGKTRFFDFSTVNVQEVKDVNKNKFFKLNMTGMGNSYNSKVQMLEGVGDVLGAWDFYTDGKSIVAHKPVQNLNESEQKGEKGSVNEQYNKMQHLLGYNPKNFINTKKTKL